MPCELLRLGEEEKEERRNVWAQNFKNTPPTMVTKVLSITVIEGNSKLFKKEINVSPQLCFSSLTQHDQHTPSPLQIAPYCRELGRGERGNYITHHNLHILCVLINKFFLHICWLPRQQRTCLVDSQTRPCVPRPLSQELCHHE